MAIQCPGNCFRFLTAFSKRPSRSHEVHAQTPEVLLETEFRCREDLAERRGSLSEVPKPGLLSHRQKLRYQAQEQSPLFQLPAEIRLAIFQFVLCDQPFFHIYADIPDPFEAGKGRFRVANCFFDDGVGNVQQVSEIQDAHPADTRHSRCLEHFGSSHLSLGNTSGGEVCDARSKFLPFLQTCRRVYTESIDMLYSDNTFVTSLGYNLDNFVRSLPSRHRLRMKSLVVFETNDYDFSEHLWKRSRGTLSKMRSLQKCHIILQELNLDPYLPEDRAAYFVNVLKDLPSTDIFSVDFWEAIPTQNHEFRYKLFNSWNAKDGYSTERVTEMNGYTGGATSD